MIRRLASCSLALLLLTGCVSTGSYYYPDNRYYQPADEYYGDYYYAPAEVDYDYYYDDPGYGFWRLDRYRCSFYGTCWSYGHGLYGSWPHGGWSYAWFPIGYYGSWGFAYSPHWQWHQRAWRSHWHERDQPRDHHDRPPVSQPGPDRAERDDFRHDRDWQNEPDHQRVRPRPRGPEPDRQWPPIEQRGPERDRYQPPAHERRPERDYQRPRPVPMERDAARRPLPGDGDYRDRSRPLMRETERIGPMPRQAMERPPMPRQPMQREPIERQPAMSPRAYEAPVMRESRSPDPEPVREPEHEERHDQ